ncbi:MAG: response regulator transcription factor [Thermoleophilia bacterium]|nr:response regulator transcription factor [Thermoleophilia bacterium]
MTKIVIVEDEPNISEVVSLYLKRAGYAVTSYADGLEALNALNDQLPDLIILDVMLPGMDGFALTRQLRDHSDVPIILLTSRRDETDRIAGLELGADDYVVKPFSPQELVSRVRAVLRRSGSLQETGAENVLVLGDLAINPQMRLVTVKEQEIVLTAKEFDLLHHMALHPRQVFTREQLLESIWGMSEYIDPSTVTVHIRRLREKIEQNPASPSHLVTVWGVGYKFEQ